MQPQFGPLLLQQEFLIFSREMKGRLAKKRIWPFSNSSQYPRERPATCSRPIHPPGSR